MALVRAISLGVGSHGGKVKPGTQFEHAGPLASWMELVEGGETSPPAPSAAPSKVADEEKPAEEIEQPEAAQAESKKRSRKVAQGAE